MNAEKVETYTLSLIRKLNSGMLIQVEGFGVGDNEETLLSVTCFKRGNAVFLRDTSESEDTREVTGLYDARHSVRHITEEAFACARERWENKVTYRTSI